MKYTITQEYDFTEEEIQFLKDIYKTRFAEYRDREINYEDYKWVFINSGLEPKSKEHFEARNFPNNSDIAKKMYSLDLIDPIEEAWHISYRPNKNTEMFLKQNNLM